MIIKSAFRHQKPIAVAIMALLEAKVNKGKRRCYKKVEILKFLSNPFPLIPNSHIFDNPDSFFFHSLDPFFEITSGLNPWYRKLPLCATLVYPSAIYNFILTYQHNACTPWIIRYRSSCVYVNTIVSKSTYL